jgi:hypothetical protein
MYYVVLSVQLSSFSYLLNEIRNQNINTINQSNWIELTKFYEYKSKILIKSFFIEAYLPN